MTQPLHTPMSFAIISGKGGVGKTNLTLNLGYALYRASHSVLLMDCDLGLANLDILLGFSPEKNLQDLLLSNIEPTDIAHPIEKNGFDFLPATSGMPEVTDLDEATQSMLFDKMTTLATAYDFLMLDIGAGISPTVLRFTTMAREVMVVVTPEPTSITDAYAVIKALYSRHGVNRFHIVVNMADDYNIAKNCFSRLSTTCKKFLNLSVSHMGSIRQDNAMVRAVISQTPLLKMAPSSKAGKDIIQLAVKLKRLRDEALPELMGMPGISLG